MKRFLVITTVLVAGMLLGAIAMGSAFAAGPAAQGTPTVPGTGAGTWGRGGMMGGGFGAGMMGGGFGAGMMGAEMGLEDEVLGLLNMTREQVIAERQAGKSLLQIAQSKNVTEQTLVTTILDAKRADLDALVASGRLTQAQADQMYQNMQQTVPQAVNRTTTGPMWGNGAAQPGNCPMFNNDTPGTTTTPAAPGRGGMRGGMMGGRWNGPST